MDSEKIVGSIIFPLDRVSGIAIAVLPPVLHGSVASNMQNKMFDDLRNRLSKAESELINLQASN